MKRRRPDNTPILAADKEEFGHVPKEPPDTSRLGDALQLFSTIREINKARMDTEHDLKLVLFSAGDLTSEQMSRVWFRRLGMPSLKTLQKATKENKVKGLSVSSRLQTDDDPTVVRARFKQRPYKGGE